MYCRHGVPRCRQAASEHIGQGLPLACRLRHHLLQLKGPAQLLPSLLLVAGGVLQSSCVAVGPLHVEPHVALLREAHGAVVALVGPLPGVFLHVHLQGALLVEGLLAQGAGERPLTCVDAAVPLQLARLGERFLTSVTLEHPGLLRA